MPSSIIIERESKSQPLISVVIPTIKGREEFFEQCLEGYKRTPCELELIIEKDYPTCGLAWQAGSEKATGKYLHFSADDLEPLDGWAECAISCCDRGYLPAPIIYGPNGSEEQLGYITPDGFFTRIPFMSMEQWAQIGPMIPLHYFTDNWISWVGKQRGIETIECEGYEFTHYWAMAGRRADKMLQDAPEYEKYKRGFRK